MTKPMVIGSQDPCPHCGKEAELHVGEGGVVWIWHPPIGCCEASKVTRRGPGPRFMARGRFKGRAFSPEEIEARKEEG